MNHSVRTALFDARGYAPEGGGTYYYLNNLIDALGARNVVCLPAFADQGVRRATLHGPTLDMARKLLDRRRQYAKAIATQKPDVFFSVHANYLPNAGTPRAQHIQDIAFLKTKYYNKLKSAFWEHELKKIVKNYEIILSISEFTKADICERFNLPESRVFVAQQGLRHEFLGKALELRQRDPPYNLLSVGVHHPRKQHVQAIRLMAELRRSGFPASLTLIGPITPYTEIIRAEISAHGLDDCVTIQGAVSDQALVAAYTSFDALLWSSAYEGFGFPLAEAMASGMPIISVNNSTVPEVTGGNFVEIDFADYAASSAVIANRLPDGPFMDTLATRAHDWVQRFTWARTAEETLKAWSSC